MAIFGDLTAMRNHEIEIIPIRAALPTFKLLSNDEHAGFRSTVDSARNVSLFSRELTLFQGAANAQHINVVRFVFDFNGHDGVFLLLMFS